MSQSSSRSPGDTNRLNRFVQDLLSQTSGTVLVVVCGIVFVAAAIGGLSLIGSLGFFGYIAYCAVLAVLALALGPVLATGFSVRRKGSAQHRADAQERLVAQRRKFGLVSPEADRRREELAPGEASPGTDPPQDDRANPFPRG